MFQFMRMLRVFVAVSVVAGGAFAQDDTAERQASRRLAVEGVMAHRRGETARSVELLNRAYELYPVPTIAYWSAQAFEQSGQWVEALERYQAALRLDDPPDIGSKQRQAQAKARADAKAAIAELEPRVPRLTVVLQGASPQETDVTLSRGQRPPKKVPPGMIGIEQLANPGTLIVNGRRGELEKTFRVDLTEGVRRTVIVRFEPADRSEPGRVHRGEPVARQDNDWRGTRTLAWVGIGVGVAGFGTGIASGLMANSQRSELADDCPRDVCTDASRHDYDRLNTLRTVSSVGFIAGVFGASMGVTLLLRVQFPIC